MRAQRFVSLFAMSLTLCGAASVAYAQPRDAPGWCAQVQGPDGGYVACDYHTRAQCLAAVSGVGGVCYENPGREGRRVEPAERPRGHRGKEM